MPTLPMNVGFQGQSGSNADIVKPTQMTLAASKRARAKNAQNCFLYRLLFVVVEALLVFKFTKSRRNFYT